MKRKIIGLYNTEPHIVNTAMMQVSQYHKNQGDKVEIYNPLFHDSYDKVYAFSIFKFTDKGYVKPDMICGGTGFDIKSKLPYEIEACDYDWSLYPDCDHSMLWFSRGCTRACDFCVVRAKEGFIHAVEPKNLNPNGNYIKVLDNNFFASPKWGEAITYLKELNQLVDFQGVDMRDFKKEYGGALQEIRIKKLHIAWDNPTDELTKEIILLKTYVKSYKITCYVLIGKNSTEAQDVYRVEKLRELNIDPFVMPFKKDDPYQSKFARYVNCKPIFKSCKWEEYKYRKDDETIH